MDKASSEPSGNLTMNFDPALSSESFSGRKRQTTLMLHSPAPDSIVIVGALTIKIAN